MRAHVREVQQVQNTTVLLTVAFSQVKPENENQASAARAAAKSVLLLLSVTEGFLQ